MTDIMICLPDRLAWEISRHAEAFGIAAEEWVFAMLSGITADLPEEAGEGGNDCISR